MKLRYYGMFYVKCYDYKVSFPCTVNRIELLLMLAVQ